MFKAIFIDFYGTLVHEMGPIAEEVDQGSNAKSPEEVYRYSKPWKEIFLYALEKNGLRPDEVIHIGDSLRSDVECPNLVGIKSIWLNREKKPVPPGVISVDSLQGVLEILEKDAE